MSHPTSDLLRSLGMPRRQRVLSERRNTGMPAEGLRRQMLGQTELARSGPAARKRSLDEGQMGRRQLESSDPPTPVIDVQPTIVPPLARAIALSQVVLLAALVSCKGDPAEAGPIVQDSAGAHIVSW